MRNLPWVLGPLKTIDGQISHKTGQSTGMSTETPHSQSGPAKIHTLNCLRQNIFTTRWCTINIFKNHQYPADGIHVKVLCVGKTGLRLLIRDGSIY